MEVEIAYSHLRGCQSFLLPVHHLQELLDLGILRATPFLVSVEFLERCRRCGLLCGSLSHLCSELQVEKYLRELFPT